MKLFEHPYFEQAIIHAAEHFRKRGLREAIIEKDYYVTEALRIIETAAGAKVIFKGGTSLSKAYGCVERFSEDVDILVLQQGRGRSALERRTRAAIAPLGSKFMVSTTPS